MTDLVKIIWVAVALITVLIFTAIQLIPAPAAAPASITPTPSPDTELLRTAGAHYLAQALAAQQPKPVITERITPDAPVIVPPVIQTEVEPSPKVRHHRRHVKSHSDICSRHKLRKVQYGKRWRCRK